ncbi:MAG: XdhC family protein [Chloroflexi bacterium]|nr:XdhC family protein [Chloroflexota bacterium]
MDTIYQTLKHFLEQDETVALAMVTDVKGSVPREVGAQMLIHPLGQHVGTVGGGCGEADVIRQGMDVIQGGEPANVRVDLTEPISLEAVGVCGGIMNVYVEQWGQKSHKQEQLAMLEAIIAASTQKTPLAILRVVRSDDASLVGQRAVVWSDDRPLLGWLGLGDQTDVVVEAAREALKEGNHRSFHLPATNTEIFIEVLQRLPRLIIVGAGHIAAPLCQIGSLCDFSVTVIDDRAQFANPQRFPQADEVIAADIQETVRALETDENTFVVLVTRGHVLDVACLLELIDRPLAYIGMIGSRRRVRAVFDLLVEEKGISREKLARVHSPIGLPIAAETPAEIAVSIMSEIINVYRGGPLSRALVETMT